MKLRAKRVAVECPAKLSRVIYFKGTRRSAHDEKHLYPVDMVFPPIYDDRPSYAERPWNGRVNSPEKCLVVRMVDKGNVSYFFVHGGKDCYTETSNPTNSEIPFWSENLAILQKRNPFGGASGKALQFSPIAFIMTGMRFHLLDQQDISKAIDKRIISFYSENPGDFADADGPRYMKEIDTAKDILATLGPQALRLAKPFLPPNFEQNPFTTKFNHDMGMVFDSDLTLSDVVCFGWKYPTTFFPKLFAKSILDLLKSKSTLDNLFGGRHCLEVFYQCCMKWRFTTWEWDLAISEMDALPTSGISADLLEKRLHYREFLAEERIKNIEAFFTPEDWFRAMHLAVDGEIALDEKGEINIKEAGSPFLQETVKLNRKTKPSIRDNSLQNYPWDRLENVREYRYAPSFPILLFVYNHKYVKGILCIMTSNWAI